MLMLNKYRPESPSNRYAGIFVFVFFLRVAESSPKVIYLCIYSFILILVLLLFKLKRHLCIWMLGSISLFSSLS